MMARSQPATSREYLQCYPRLCSHIIAESLGYITPPLAAQILKDAREGNVNHCVWVTECYEGDPKRVIEDTFRKRHYHHGPLELYRVALSIVRIDLALQEGSQPKPGSDPDNLSTNGR